MKVTLVMFRSGDRRDFPVAAGSTVIGRRQESGLRIPTRDVSRQHCELVLTEKKLTVKDLGSSNGTYVNGKRVAESPLAAGDNLRVGPVTFIVQIDGQPAKITPHDVKAPLAAGPKAANADAADLDEDDLFDMDDAEFDLDDPITALNGLDDDDDDEPPPPKKK